MNITFDIKPVSWTSYCFQKMNLFAGRKSHIPNCTDKMQSLSRYVFFPTAIASSTLKLFGIASLAPTSSLWIISIALETIAQLNEQINPRSHSNVTFSPCQQLSKLSKERNLTKLAFFKFYQNHCLDQPYPDALCARGEALKHVYEGFGRSAGPVLALLKQMKKKPLRDSSKLFNCITKAEIAEFTILTSVHDQLLCLQNDLQCQKELWSEITGLSAITFFCEPPNKFQSQIIDIVSKHLPENSSCEMHGLFDYFGEETACKPLNEQIEKEVKSRFKNESFNELMRYLAKKLPPILGRGEPFIGEILGIIEKIYPGFSSLLLGNTNHHFKKNSTTPEITILSKEINQKLIQQNAKCNIKNILLALNDRDKDFFSQMFTQWIKERNPQSKRDKIDEDAKIAKAYLFQRCSDYYHFKNLHVGSHAPAQKIDMALQELTTIYTHSLEGLSASQQIQYQLNLGPKALKKAILDQIDQCEEKNPVATILCTFDWDLDPSHKFKTLAQFTGIFRCYDPSDKMHTFSSKEKLLDYQLKRIEDVMRKEKITQITPHMICNMAIFL